MISGAVGRRLRDVRGAIAEDRQLTTKYDEMKRLGYLLGSVGSLTKTDPIVTRAPDNPARVWHGVTGCRA